MNSDTPFLRLFATPMKLAMPLVAGYTLALSAHAAPLEVKSPDGSLKVTFKLEKGVPHYSVTKGDTAVIKDSRLGIKLKGKTSFAEKFQIASHTRDQHNSTWEQPWGEQRFIKNHYQELKINLSDASATDARKMSITFRVYDDGLGFRYDIPEQLGVDAITVTDELTEFHLTGDHRSWSIGAFQENRYEYAYVDAPLSKAPHKKFHTPITMVTPEGLYLSLHEAALTDYSSMALTLGEDNLLKATLFPWSDGTLVKAQKTLRSPWRTLQVADAAHKLLENYLILTLNEPSVMEDTSWIEPGKYIGIWWELHLKLSTWGSGPKHGATTSNTKKYIDFAAKHGFKGVLVEGWNTGWDGDWIKNGDRFNFTQPYPDYDIKELARYAKEKGTRLIGHHETGAAVENYERQLDPAFRFLAEHGMNAVKTGYVGYYRAVKRTDSDGIKHDEWHHGQHMVRHYRKVIKTAAKHKIMLNVHEPIKPTGLRRTFPHMMTREGAKGQEFNAWGGKDINKPVHTTVLPFTRMLAGPMDFTPGIFDLTFEGLNLEPNRVSTTLAKQLALYVVLYSPLQMAADLPENYLKRPKAFQFIKDVPCDWSETRGLAAEIGDHVVITRKDRNSEDWYLGGVTDEAARTLTVDLSFLDAGKSYQATIYKDGEGAHWKTNPYPLSIVTRKVTANDKMKLALAAGGGTAIRFSPVSE